LLLALFSFGCSVNVSQSNGGAVAKNACTADSDCSDGECWLPVVVSSTAPASGVCVAHQGELSSVLLSLTPPASTPFGVGGLGFSTIETGLVRSSVHDLQIDGASVVHGYIKSACPFEVTLTPQAQSYGLATPTYVALSSAVQTAAVACRDELSLSGTTQEFVANVPPGTFDVYIRPAIALATADAGAPDCGAVPEVFPGLVKAQAGVSCVSITQVAPQALDVRIPWPSDAPTLEKWTLDVVHPVTGQVLSQASPALQGGPTAIDGAFYYSQRVTYSPIAAGSSLAGQELIRLSPPPAPPDMPLQPPAGPVLQFSVAAAIASSPAPASGPQKAILPSNIGSFPSKVKVETWVYRDDDFAKGIMTGVPSTVTFSATNLNLPGIFASYSATAVVEPQDEGHLAVDLIPGDYLVHVVPVVEPGDHVPLASQESTRTIPPSTGASGATQVVRNLLVKNAAVVKGRALSASGNGGIAAASVQALPAATGTRRCMTDADAAACAAQPVGVLETSLAESAYVPRTASAVTARDGSFTLSGVDCGGCDKQVGGASFDVVVQPADGTQVPWLVWPQVTVVENRALPLLRATLPIIQRGKVVLPSAMTEAPTALPGTLIRAYLIRDASGAPILDDPTGLPSCSSGTYTGDGNTTRCIRSALQVAETRADSDGNYELVLPASVDATAE
jgi:hypothetical protein